MLGYLTLAATPKVPALKLPSKAGGIYLPQDLYEQYPCVTDRDQH